MRNIIIAILLTIAISALDQSANITCYSYSVQSAANLYISFNKAAYKYTIPDLQLQKSQNHNQFLCSPGTLSNNILTFGAYQSNLHSIKLSAVDLSILSQSNSAAPYPPYIYFYRQFNTVISFK
jgi:hypothetical protein